MSIHGLTIDYGPYGWLEDYNPGWTPSSNTTDAYNPEDGSAYNYGEDIVMEHRQIGHIRSFSPVTNNYNALLVGHQSNLL